FTLCLVAPRPALPPALRLLQGGGRVGWTRLALMRAIPGEHERHGLAFVDGELADRRHVAAFELDRRAQHQRVGTGDRVDAAVAPAHPGDDAAIIEAEDRLHADPHAAALAVEQAHDLDRVAPRRHGHEIGENHAVAARAKAGLE